MTAATGDLRCVVCDRAIGEHGPHYANAWERTRKRSPCCSPGCAQAFDPDVHWIPAAMPALAPADEQAAMRRMAATRLGQLDQARPVVRELLVAGLKPETLRGLVVQSQEASTSERKRGRWSLIAALLLRRPSAARISRDERTDRSYADALADLDRWTQVVAERARAS